MGENISTHEGLFMMHKADKELHKPSADVTPLGVKDGFEMLACRPDSEYVKLLIIMRDGEKVIGVLNIGTYDNEVQGIYMDKLYRGKGLGFPMYLGALHVLKQIRSSADLGIMAVKTWQKVSRYADVTLCNLETKQTVDFEWGADSIPVVNGKPISKGKNAEDEFIFKAKSR